MAKPKKKRGTHPLTATLAAALIGSAVAAGLFYVARYPSTPKREPEPGPSLVTSQGPDGDVVWSGAHN